MNGFSAIALGAFGAHGLEKQLDAGEMIIYETAVLYHLVHAVVILCVSLFQTVFPSPWFKRSFLGFMCGTIIFSGSLYLLAITGVRWLGAITPVGGLLLMAGWLFIFPAARILAASVQGSQNDD